MCQPNNTRRSKTSTVSLPMPMQTPANILSPSCSISDQEEDGKTYSTLNSKPLKVLMCSENVFRKYAHSHVFLVYNDTYAHMSYHIDIVLTHTYAYFSPTSYILLSTSQWDCQACHNVPRWSIQARLHC